MNYILTPREKEIFELLIDNYDTKDIAKELKISVVSLSKIVKNYSGKTFKDLLQEKRLSEAEKLILNTKIPVTEIIFAVGYENTNFFYKLFSQKYGCTPKEYRKNRASKKKKIRS